MLVDAEFHGRPRKLLLQANRNGFFYVLDRVTGEFLLGQPFVHKLTWASGIGPDGRPKLLPGSEPTVEGTKVCPAVAGATNWMSTAYNPATGLFYVMAQRVVHHLIRSRPPGGSRASRSMAAARGAFPARPASDFCAPSTSRPERSPGRFRRSAAICRVAVGAGCSRPPAAWSSFCDDSGAFAAVDARNGKPLWNFHTNQGWHASPDDLHGGRQAVRGRSRRFQHHCVRSAVSVQAVEKEIS